MMATATQQVDSDFPKFLGYLVRCRNFDTDKMMFASMVHDTYNYAHRNTPETYFSNQPSKRMLLYDRALEYIKTVSIEYGTKVCANNTSDLSHNERLYAYLMAWKDYLNIVKRINIGMLHVIQSARYTENLVNDATSEWAKHGLTTSVESRAIDMLGDLRRGNVIDITLLKTIISHIEAFALIGVSMDDFIKTLEESSKSYYRFISSTIMGKHSIREYIEIVAVMINEDDKRCEKLFCKDTAAIISAAITEPLVIEHYEVILKEFSSIMCDNVLTPSIYILFSRDIENFHSYVLTYELHWKTLIIDGLKKCTNEVQFATFALEKYMTMMLHTREYFGNNVAFVNATKKIMREAFSARGLMNPALAFAEYLNSMLKRTGIQKDESEKVPLVIQAIETVAFIDDKDEFVQHYSKMLGHRLINNNSVSQSLENDAFGQLKKQFGIEATQKLKSMFDDIKVSDELRAEYLKNNAVQFTFIPLVLTQSAWNMEQNYGRLIIPIDAARQLEIFAKYYTAKYPSKRLTWSHSASRVTVSIALGAHTYQLLCSMEQYVVLAQFTPTITKADLPGLTGIPMSIIEKILESFVKAKFVGPNKDKTRYALNPKFKSDLLLINCSALMVSQQAVSDEVKRTQREVDERRIHNTTACIVRNMKKHKKMDVKDLRNAVFEQTVQFSMTIPIFKAAIEYCIEKEFIETEGSAADKIEYKYIES